MLGVARSAPLQLWGMGEHVHERHGLKWLFPRVRGVFVGSPSNEDTNKLGVHNRPLILGIN